MEPMTLGSPNSSPGSNQNLYLPPFLMGDAQSMIANNNSLSHNQGCHNVIFTSSANIITPQEITGNYSAQLNLSAGGTHTIFAGCNSNGSTTNISHQTGPPTQGLFDSLRIDSGTPQRPQFQKSHFKSSNYSLSQWYSSTTHLDESYVANISNTAKGSKHEYNPPLGSPLKLTQSPQVHDDFWVIIFGFSPGANSTVLQHFTMFGTILDVVNAPQNGNWMYVRFSSRVECDKALNFNLKFIASNLIVGVTSCKDENIDKEIDKAGSITKNWKLNVRPLVKQSYDIARYDTQVSPKRVLPQKSSGLMHKAMDLLFGW